MSKAKKAAADSAPPAENHPIRVDGTLASPASQTVPSLEFLASIAAILAGGRKVDSVEAVAPVDEALAIWDAASLAHQRRLPESAEGNQFTGDGDQSTGLGLWLSVQRG